MEHLEKFGLEPHKSAAVLVGERFGFCLVLATGKQPGTYKYRAVCICDCGATFAPMCSGLRNGTTKSCGCKNRADSTKHGLRKSPVYSTWQHMLRRCNEPADAKYADYGARGIRVCERWHDLRAFHEDMAPTWRPGMTLERRDNSRGYEPSNCEWANASAQSRNKRNNILVTLNGRTQILKDWCIELGISYGMARSRIKDMGWEPEKALRLPPNPRKQS